MPTESRPAFARDFPRSPALDALVEAFARGDYAHVRVAGPDLERTSDDQAIQRAARTLVERTTPDPLAIALVGLAAVLFIVFATWAIGHGHAPPGVEPHR